MSAAMAPPLRVNYPQLAPGITNDASEPSPYLPRGPTTSLPEDHSMAAKGDLEARSDSLSSHSPSPRNTGDSSATDLDSDTDNDASSKPSGNRRQSLGPALAADFRALSAAPPVRHGTEIHLHFDGQPHHLMHSGGSSSSVGGKKAADKSSPNVSQPLQVPNASQGRLQSYSSSQQPTTVALTEALEEARRRRDELDDVLVGTRVSEGHESYVTAYNMLTGIRFAVSKVTAPQNRKLTDSDFLATSEQRFDPDPGSHGNQSKHDFRFKDYAPWVFRHLRDLFKLDQADYLMSLTAKYIVSELGSPGKSGSFFYYSRDYRFIIKTIRHEEHKRLRRILRDYYAHVRSNPDTLLSQFYGLHRVRLPFGKKIYFVVMNNVFPALYEIHKRYDLKGSLQGREYHASYPPKPIAVYKDVDFLRAHDRLVLGPEKRERFMKQLEADVRLLERVNVMDYSLLVGVHDMAKGNAAVDKLLDLCEFGPPRQSLDAAGVDTSSKSVRAHRSRQEFAELQKQLSRANPRRLREFDFAEDFRSSFYFYHDHGGMLSTDANNEPRDVIYYVGVIDFLTHYNFRKRVETYFKGLRYKRSDISALPAYDYGERFLKRMAGAVGPEIVPIGTERGGRNLRSAGPTGASGTSGMTGLSKQQIPEESPQPDSTPLPSILGQSRPQPGPSGDGRPLTGSPSSPAGTIGSDATRTETAATTDTGTIEPGSTSGYIPQKNPQVPHALAAFGSPV